MTLFFNLNPLLDPRATPMPTLEDIRAEVVGSTYFTTVDLKEAFFQIPLEENSKKFTCFGCTGSRNYAYNVIPMGCSVSTSLLQESLTEVLDDFYFKGAIIYCDDVLIYSDGSK